MSSSLCGWIDDPRSVAETVGRWADPILGLAVSREFLATEHRDVLLWEQGEVALFGKPLGAHRQTIGDCLPAETRVLGSRTKRLADVNVGDIVFDGNGSPTRVISKREKLTHKPLVRLKCRGALPVEATQDHQVLIVRPERYDGRDIDERLVAEGRCQAITAVRVAKPQWIAAGEVVAGDYLLSPTNFGGIRISNHGKAPLDLRTDAVWWLIGYFLANGHASGGTVEWTIPAKKPEIVTKITETLTANGFTWGVSTYEDREASRVRCNSVALVKWFNDKFTDEHGKQFPGWAIGDKSLLDGLTDGDGSRVGRGFVITSTSLSIIHGVEATLLNLGLSPSVGPHPRGKGVYANAKPLYHVQWSENPGKRYTKQFGEYVGRRVQSVETLEGPHTVYDIGVESAQHSFIANGLVVHNCVSHGWARGIQDLIYVDLAAAVLDGRLTLDEARKLALQVATEPVYALSRVEVGRGRLGRDDGSIGAWAAEAVTKYGILLRRAYGSLDLTTYSGQLAKRLGAPGAGLPDELEPTARQYAVSRAPLVVTDDEAQAALYNLYPIPICSSQGFTEQRDKYGFCDPRGTWKHCMCGRGIVKARRAGKSILAVPIQQSWGENPTGPSTITLDSGREVELPQGVFLCEFDVFVGKILRARDSFAPAGPQGFVKRFPNFTI